MMQNKISLFFSCSLSPETCRPGPRGVTIIYSYKHDTTHFKLLLSSHLFGEFCSPEIDPASFHLHVHKGNRLSCSCKYTGVSGGIEEPDWTENGDFDPNFNSRSGKLSGLFTFNTDYIVVNLN